MIRAATKPGPPLQQGLGAMGSVAAGDWVAVPDWVGEPGLEAPVTVEAPDWAVGPARER
jgi:hypothetical protein